MPAPFVSYRRAATAIAGLLAVFLFTAAAAQAPKAPPAGSAVATFAGGCFWCMEPPYDKLDGVVSTTSGYMGGTVKNPTYAQVSSGSTGHAEVVQVVYDPKKVSYEKLLEVFWKNIDPTVKDRQFCDVGTQYRTAIFTHTDAQRVAAEKSKALIESTKPFRARSSRPWSPRPSSGRPRTTIRITTSRIRPATVITGPGAAATSD
jgi:peptide-methionine (S)-S-oxide reductase